jgi:hypothetical protein
LFSKIAELKAHNERHVLTLNRIEPVNRHRLTQKREGQNERTVFMARILLELVRRPDSGVRLADIPGELPPRARQRLALQLREARLATYSGGRKNRTWQRGFLLKEIMGEPGSDLKERTE